MNTQRRTALLDAAFLVGRSGYVYRAFLAAPTPLMPWPNTYQAKCDTFISHGSGVRKDADVVAGVTPRSNETWLAVLGPDTPPLGERRDTPLATQAQIAATVAAFLGENFREFQPAAAPALSEVLGER